MQFLQVTDDAVLNVVTPGMYGVVGLLAPGITGARAADNQGWMKAFHAMEKTFKHLGAVPHVAKEWGFNADNIGYVTKFDAASLTATTTTLDPRVNAHLGTSNSLSGSGDSAAPPPPARKLLTSEGRDCSVFASLPRVAGSVETEPPRRVGVLHRRAAAVRAAPVELAEPRALLGTAFEDELASLVSHCTHPVSSGGGGGGGCFLPVASARVTPQGAHHGGCSAWRLAASVPCSRAAVQVGCHQVTGRSSGHSRLVSSSSAGRSSPLVSHQVTGILQQCR
eukprot:scaffold55253_cov61-Phaeocystis_antarctica.AAC.14